ncbi:MAG: 50S ribosomal protein L17 [Ekhidna sp.]|uniref:50S ribosomal protein L17 n=1 Tax=Ekhidna sp. TaxID=2608089 RepID=UPI0032EFC866
MRHGKKFNHLGRKTAHRSAMLSNMASSLIIHKRINTTVAKAKALRKFIEPILTKSKTDDTNSRRVVFSYLQDKESVTELFNNIAGKIANRPGGYTRIIKTGARLGDNAEMCMMELVDFNELLLGDESVGKAKTRRSRRGGKSQKEEAPKAEVAEVQEEIAEEVTSGNNDEEVEAKSEEGEEPQSDSSEESPEEEKK